MFKKISKIKNIAVYNNFIWDNEVKESNGQISEFRTVNILYGRNYSGKTTLSRIFRSLETNMLSDKYKKPEFNLETLDGESISQLNIGHHNLNIRVFNEDFIKDNLKFISNSDESINSFAILGENNKNLI
ncbi:TPA: AAA family ATPase, partial [Yersinia enterocolitica]|nr:AAA family ATPase [Yersinia enterocolitica]